MSEGPLVSFLVEVDSFSRALTSLRVQTAIIERQQQELQAKFLSLRVEADAIQEQATKRLDEFQKTPLGEIASRDPNVGATLRSLRATLQELALPLIGKA